MIQRTDKPNDWKNCGKPVKLSKEEIRKIKEKGEKKNKRVPTWDDCSCPFTCEDCNCYKKDTQ